MNDYSAYKAAKVTIPILVIHDKDDLEVPVKAAQHIYDHLKNGKLLLTEGLGHRKILGDSEVIQRTVQFVALINKKIIHHEISFEKICNSMERRAGRRKYRVLREKERSVHTAELTIYTMKKALIVVALVQNHY
jgi:hypothetical protein